MRNAAKYRPPGLNLELTIDRPLPITGVTFSVATSSNETLPVFTMIRPSGAHPNPMPGYPVASTVSMVLMRRKPSMSNT
jgi:hypothetical protein